MNDEVKYPLGVWNKYDEIKDLDKIDIINECFKEWWKYQELQEKDKEIERLKNIIYDTTETLNETYNNRTELRNENGRLNNIIKHIYKELRTFNNCGNMGVSMQITYLEEYIQENIEQIEENYLQELEEGK